MIRRVTCRDSAMAKLHNQILSSADSKENLKYYRHHTERNLIREFNSNIYGAIRETGEIMKAHCRIKKSTELTAREQVQSACLACLPGVAQILPLQWMPPGLNEANYTSLRVIRRVDDRDGDEVRIRASGESVESSNRSLSLRLSMSLFLSLSFFLFDMKETPGLIVVVNMLL